MGGILKTGPQAVRMEVWPWHNGKAKRVPPPAVYLLKFAGAGLSGTDKFGLPVQRNDTESGVELRLKEQEHRFSEMLRTQNHDIEKRDLQRRVDELERDLKAKEAENAELKEEIGGLESEYERRLASTATAMKLGGKGLGGLLTGVIGQLRPDLAGLATQKIDSLLARLTGIPDTENLPEAPDSYEDGGAAAGLSDAAFADLDTLAETELALLERLLRRLARAADPELRAWMLDAALEAVEKLAAPPRQQPAAPQEPGPGPNGPWS